MLTASVTVGVALAMLKAVALEEAEEEEQCSQCDQASGGTVLL